MSEGIKLLRDEYHDTVVKSFSKNGLTTVNNQVLHTLLTKVLHDDLSMNEDEVVESSQDSELGDNMRTVISVRSTVMRRRGQSGQW